MKYPKRDQGSHKGQNGKILIIGGNEFFHGAPILTARGAEASGSDLIFLGIPKKHAVVARIASENFIVHEFKKDYFSELDVNHFIEFGNSMCTAFVIGNGLGTKKDTHKSLIKFLENIKIPGIIDADGLIPEVLKIKRKNEWIFTPHSIEFERIFGMKDSKNNIKEMSKRHDITILKKGVVDIIASKNKYFENITGCAEMTVGGSGDALAGVCGALLSQGQTPFDSAKIAAYFWGKAGEKVLKNQKFFSSKNICKIFPKTIK